MRRDLRTMGRLIAYAGEVAKRSGLWTGAAE